MKASIATLAATALIGFSALAHAGDAVIIITHEVKDFAVWKKGYDADKDNREKAGLTVRYLARDAEKPNVVTVVMEAPNAAAGRAFATNPMLKEVMTKAGVISVPSITIAEITK
jgi:hypothetical protein